MTTNNNSSLEQDLLFAIIKEKYGRLLTDEQLEGVRTRSYGAARGLSGVACRQAYQRRGTLLQLQALPSGIGQWLSPLAHPLMVSLSNHVPLECNPSTSSG